MVAWLHLSDLHLRGDADWERDVVLRDLRRDLPGLVDSVGIRPELLFVTGDVAWSGAAGEYEGAQRLLGELAEGLGLELRERGFVVPGNHDVDRSELEFIAPYQDQVLALADAEFRSTVGRLVTEPSRMLKLGERLRAFCDHTGRVLGAARAVSPDRPWRSDVVELDGVRVGVASLCSAWMCGPDDDSKQRRIVLGEAQVRELSRELDEGGARLRIALMHHPPDWLHEAEDGAVMGVLRRDFDLLLHGHRHRAEASGLVSGGGELVVVEAGSAYAGSGWYHACSLGAWDAERGEARLCFLTWDARDGGRWRVDAGQGEGGIVTLPMAGKSTKGGVVVPPIPSAIAKRLRAAVLRVHGQQGFLGLPDSAPRPHATLMDVFVPLELRERGRGEAEPVVRSLEELLPRWLERGGKEAAARVVVLGDPGSGKTTLGRYLALQTVERTEGLVPLLLTARSWVREGASEGLLQMAARQAAAVLSIPATEEQLTALCASGRALLIVDGIDEVAVADEREALRARVQGFAASYPAVPVVVTSRIVGYDDVPLAPDVFETFVLEPFDDARQEQFIQRWYAVAEPNDPSARARKQEELLSALRAEPRAQQLARNPLLATLIALVHHHQAELPGRRARLYELVVDLMLVTWPAARGRRFDEIDSDRQRVLLEQLALNMQMGRGGIPDSDVLVRRDDLERLLARLIRQRFTDLDLAEAKGRARRWLRWLEASSGILVEQQPGRCGFVHLSIMEYLAGRAAYREASRGGNEQVVELVAMRHEDQAWWETLLLMLGSEADDRVLVSAVMSRLLEEEDGVSPRLSTLVFAGSMLREEVDVEPFLRDQLLALWEPAMKEFMDRVATSFSPNPTALGHFLMGSIAAFSRRHGEAVRQWLKRRG